MIPINEAQALILPYTTPQEPEQVPLTLAQNRVLAEDVRAAMPIPPFNRSPLDGFAFSAAATAQATADNPVLLSTVGTIGAGSVWDTPLARGECLRIMTGAPLPQGADAVAAMEHVTVCGEQVAFPRPYQPGENVSAAGEDIEAGRLVLRAGRQLGPVGAAILASLGVQQVAVFRRPRVAVLATGSELMPVGRPLTAGKIYESNSLMLSGLAEECGAMVTAGGIVPDNPALLARRLRDALADNDVVLTSGGVSVGDYDLTREAVLAVGARILFHRVAVKPGTPLLAAVSEGKLLFCLSGNPAAAFATFHLFVRPALLRIQGLLHGELPWLSAALLHDLDKKGRQNRLIRAVTVQGEHGLVVRVAGRDKPGVLSTLSEANSLVFLPAKKIAVSAGEHVSVLLTGRAESIFSARGGMNHANLP